MYIVQQIEVPGVDILSAQASYPCKQFPKNLLWSGWDLFFIDLAVGVYHPGEIHPDKYENVWKTVSLIVWIRRDIYSKDKVVILYGGFCVLQGIIELIKLGFFASALVKKRQHQPTLVTGDDTNYNFSTKYMGDTDSLNEHIYNHYYKTFLFKRA